MQSLINANKKDSLRKKRISAFSNGVKLLKKQIKRVTVCSAEQQSRISAAMIQNNYDGETCVIPGCNQKLTKNVKMTGGVVGNYCESCRTYHPLPD